MAIYWAMGIGLVVLSFLGFFSFAWAHDGPASEAKKPRIVGSAALALFVLIAVASCLFTPYGPLIIVGTLCADVSIVVIGGFIGMLVLPR